MTAGHHSLIGGGTSYPWDYRVAYFEVATTYPCFECGPLKIWNTNWELDPGYNTNGSAFQLELLNNFKWESIFSFPKSLSTDQKISGGPGTFCIYPYANRYNVGGLGNWLTSPSTSESSVISSTNTITRAFCQSAGSNSVQYSITQGNNTVTNTVTPGNQCFSLEEPYPIFLHSEGGSYQIRNVYAGTRIYETSLDIDMSGSNEAHLRFVPCMLDNTPYICEMYSKTLIANSMSGTVTAGPAVKDNYNAWTER